MAGFTSLRVAGLSAFWVAGFEALRVAGLVRFGWPISPGIRSRHHLAERDTLPARFVDKARAQAVRGPIALEAPEPRTPLHDPRDMIGAEGVLPTAPPRSLAFAKVCLEARPAAIRIGKGHNPVVARSRT